MSNTSATGGYLESTDIVGQADVEDALQAAVAGITGLPGNLVRPRWQPEPPRQPKAEVTWCAIGALEYAATSHVRHDSEGDGYDVIVTHADVSAMASFYGPDADGAAFRLRDGLLVAQNRAALRKQGLAVVEIGTVSRRPEPSGTRWLERLDVPLVFRWGTERRVPVLNILKSSGTMEADAGTEPVVSFGCGGQE